MKGSSLQPTLENERVLLRPLRTADFEDLFAAAADPLIWEQHPVKNRCERAGFTAFFEESLASGGCLVVVDGHTQKIIGSSRYKCFASAPSVVEIGWSFLVRSYWGGEYNAAVKGLMIAHAVQHWTTVVFFIDPHNLRSQKAVQKIGANLVVDQQGIGEFPVPEDHLVFAITS